MIEQLRTALKTRNETESWRYLAEQTGLDASQLRGFALGYRQFSAKSLEILADYLGLSLSRR